MSGFDNRISKANIWEKELYELLKSNSKIVCIIQNGTEHTHTDFVAQLRQNYSEASKFIRYSPDGVFLTRDGKVIHYDAKNSKAMEKEAYETYMKYHACGCTVLIYIKWENVIYYQAVEKIKYKNSYEVVKPFGNKGFPVREDGWIYPRDKVGFISTENQSGTPYKEIDFSSMKIFHRLSGES